MKIGRASCRERVQRWWGSALSQTAETSNYRSQFGWASACSCFFFFSSRRRHTRCSRDWSSDVCSSDLLHARRVAAAVRAHEAEIAAAHRAGVVERVLARERAPAHHAVLALGLSDEDRKSVV